MPRYETRPCASCGKVRKVQVRGGRPISDRCHPCGARHRTTAKPGSWASRERHGRWKGGRYLTSVGYYQVLIAQDDPLLPMADRRGRVYEHRLVMARHLGRVLQTDEQVHHRNGDKLDNRISNLELTTLAAHSAAHHAEIRFLRARVQELERELAEATSP